MNSVSGYHVIFSYSRYGLIDSANIIAESENFFVLSSASSRPCYLRQNGIHMMMDNIAIFSAWRDQFLAVTFDDNKKVNILTNYFNSGRGDGYTELSPLEAYREHSGRVDHFNHLVAEHQFHHRHYSWKIALFDGLLKFAVTNSYIIY